MHIVASGLSKSYGFSKVVDDLSFDIKPGRITGFLGPNGAGKSTTMALMLQLANGRGKTLFYGKTYASLPGGTRRIGVFFSPDTFHDNYSARKHLYISAFTRGIPFSRVKEVLNEVGLGNVGGKKIKNFSTGMKQKLGIATALLSSPEVLILDEPANGLDPQSIQWLRQLLIDFAAAGGTVFLSSHLISEIALFADDLLVIAKGALIVNESMDTFLTRETPSAFKVRTRQSEEFQLQLDKEGVPHQRLSEDVLEIRIESSLDFLTVAVARRIEITEILPVGSSVEDIYLMLTSGLEAYRSGSDATTDLPEESETDTATRLDLAEPESSSTQPPETDSSLPPNESSSKKGVKND